MIIPAGPVSDASLYFLLNLPAQLVWFGHPEPITIPQIEHGLSSPPSSLVFLLHLFSKPRTQPSFHIKSKTYVL